VLRALASHHCGPGSNPGPGIMSGLSLLLVFALFRAQFCGFPPCVSMHVVFVPVGGNPGQRRITN